MTRGEQKVIDKRRDERVVDRVKGGWRNDVWREQREDQHKRAEGGIDFSGVDKNQRKYFTFKT